MFPCGLHWRWLYLSGALRAINVHNSAVFIYSTRNYYYYTVLKPRCAAYNTVIFPALSHTHPLSYITLTPCLVLWRTLRADRDNRKFITPPKRPKTTSPRYLGSVRQILRPVSKRSARAPLNATAARHCLASAQTRNNYIPIIFTWHSYIITSRVEGEFQSCDLDSSSIIQLLWSLQKPIIIILSISYSFILL